MHNVLICLLGYEEIWCKCSLQWAHRIAAITGIEQSSIPAILIFEVVRIVSTCFKKIVRITVIAGVAHSDPNDRNDYMETRLKTCEWDCC